MNVLDCTLRDGGYYNLWDFDPEVVAAYLTAAAAAGINYIELGLRNFPKSQFLGAFAYTTESHLNRMILPDGPVYGLMVDAKTIIESGMSVESSLAALFVPAQESKISLVRVAAHFHEIDQCESIVKGLKDRGYIVGLNLMQSGGKSDSAIEKKAATIVDWETVDVLYFADSFGNMDGCEVKRIIKALRKFWLGELGIHTHNNMSKALDNTLVALGEGVSWVDVTVTGMGRGAGNAQTELLLSVLSKQQEAYNPSPVYELVIRYFESMQKHYGWGSNLLYFLGAQHDIHPTYIQKLLSDRHYGTDEIVGAVDYLTQLDGTNTYDGSILENALRLNVADKPVSGSKELINRLSGKSVLIIGGGPSVSHYLDAIIAYIEDFSPVVVSINVNTLVPEKYIDYYCISHNSKFLSESGQYASLKKPLILPKHRFNDSELKLIGENVEVLDYGLVVGTERMGVHSSWCQLPSELTIGYALSISHVGDARRIYVVGFDGYELGDPRQIEMIELVTQYNQHVSTPSICALTPTSYPIEQGSIYAPPL